MGASQRHCEFPIHFFLRETLIFCPYEPFLLGMQICARVLAFYCGAALLKLIQLKFQCSDFDLICFSYKCGFSIHLVAQKMDDKRKQLAMIF
ncbi:unnamed protein product [Prunus brigantina]